MYIGRTTTSNEKLKELLHISKAEEQDLLPVNTIIKAATEMGISNMGALLIISKSEELKFYEDTGDALDALISKRLLLSIFNKFSPLHDGAVILRDDRVIAARCIIPVSENEDLPAHYGLRHRAAIGITEETDCIVIIVSEETGSLSLAHEGKLDYGLSSSQMRSKINNLLYASKKELIEEE